MFHLTQAPQPLSPSSIRGERLAYPSCPIELRCPVRHASQPTWEELLGQR